MPRRAKSPSPNSRFGLFFASLLLCILTSFSLVACSRAALSDPSSLTLIIESNPANLDPRFATDAQTSTDEQYRLIAAALQEQWRRAGIDLELRPLELATLLSDAVKGNFQLNLLRWVGRQHRP
jgi:ABC-type transport system substrate-binding protein